MQQQGVGGIEENFALIIKMLKHPQDDTRGGAELNQSVNFSLFSQLIQNFNKYNKHIDIKQCESNY